MLALLFAALLAEEPQRFIWWRTTLPLVCRRWAALLRSPRPGLFAHVTINARAECAAVKRAGGGGASSLSRTSADLASASAASAASRGVAAAAAAAAVASVAAPSADALGGGIGVRAASPEAAASPLLGNSPVPGSSPMRGGWVGPGSPPSHHHGFGYGYLQQQQQQQQQQQRHHWSPRACGLGGGGGGAFSGAGAGGGPCTSGCVGGSSPPPRALQHSASASRVRARLSARRVQAWLQARAGAVAAVTLDLRGPHHHDFTTAAVERLMRTLAPSLRSLRLAGAPVDGGDCCDALGALRGLQRLEVTAAAPSVLGSGTSPLAYLPRLRTLLVALDIAPACPERLRDLLPAGLRHLGLANVALAELPRALADLGALTALRLERCSVAANPLPLLLSLTALRHVDVVASQLPGLTGPPQPPHLAAAPLPAPLPAPSGHRRRSSSGGGGGGAMGRAQAHAPGALVEAVALVGCGLPRVPAQLAALPALAALDVSRNAELGADPGGCLPAALATLPRLRALSLAHCGLAALPPVVAELQWLTRLELGGNGLTALPHRPLACAPQLEVLGLAGTRLRAPPAWLLLGGAPRLRELAVSAGCLAGPAVAPAGGSGGSAGAAGIAAAARGGSGAAGASSGSGAVGLALGQLSVGDGGGGPGSWGEPSSTAAALFAGPGGSGHGSPRALADAAGSGGTGGGSGTGGGWLRDLPEQLPGLALLRVEGALWEQAAVRNLMALLARPRGTGALRVELI